MDSSSDKDLQCLSDRFLKCVVCYKFFDDDLRKCRLLPCLHNICNNCINDVYYSDKEDKIICPNCKTVHRFQGDYSKFFPKDNTKRDLLRLAQQHRVMPCDTCRTGNPVIYLCKMCSLYLCQTCQDDHATKCNSHTILRISKEMAHSTRMLGKCSVRGHEDENINLFCSKEGCESLICNICASADHKADSGHIVISIEDASLKEKEKIINEKTKAMTVLKDIEETTSSIQTELTEIKNQRRKVLEDIQSTFGKDIDVLTSRRDELIEEVNDFLDKQSNELLDLKSSLRNEKLMIQDCITFFDYSSLTQNTSELVRIAPTVTSRFRYLNSHAKIKTIGKQKSIQFSPCGFSKIEQDPRNLGEIILHSSDGNNQQQAVETTEVKTDTVTSNQVVRDTKEIVAADTSTQYKAQLDICMDLEKDKKNVYQLPVFVVKNELAKEVVDVIVNTTSKELLLSSGTVSNSLLKAAGKQLQQECRKIAPRGINYGEFVVTDGYNLKCKKVYHGALPQYSNGGLEMLEKLMMGCLLDASLAGMLSICFPAFGTGKLQYPKVAVAETMFNVAEKFFKTNGAVQNCIKYVKIVVHPKDAESCKIFEDEERKRKSSLQTKQEP